LNPLFQLFHMADGYTLSLVLEHRTGLETRPGDPTYALYVVSSDQPDQAYSYRPEFLFKPRIGVCAADGGSHSVLGYNFVLPHSLGEGRQRDPDWFRCRKCASLFHARFHTRVTGATVWRRGGICPDGGTHEANLSYWGTFEYAIPDGRAEDEVNQAKWRRCRKCQMMFWSGYSPSQGICPADGLRHEPADQIPYVVSHDYVLPHDQPEDSNHVANWRRCKVCSCLFWDGLWLKGRCPDGTVHDAIGNETADPVGALVRNELILTHNVQGDSHHQADWRLCTKCLGLYRGDDPTGNVCPSEGKHESNHKDLPYLSGRIEPPVECNFVLPHDLPEDASHEGSWRGCTKCGLLFSYLYFFDLHSDKWTALAQAPVAAGDPSTMVTEGQQHVFYRGVDGAINHIFLNAADNSFHFDQWTELAHAPLAAGDPSTIVTGGQQHIFYRGTDSAINHVFWTPGTTRPLHQDWTAFARQYPSAAGDVATMVLEDQQHVFYRGMDGDVSDTFWKAANKCPAGDSHSPSAEQFVLQRRRIQEDQYNERDWRFCTKCFALVSTKAGAQFWTLDSAVVRNSEPRVCRIRRVTDFSFSATAGLISNWHGCLLELQAPGSRIRVTSLCLKNHLRRARFRRRKTGKQRWRMLSGCSALQSFQTQTVSHSRGWKDLNAGFCFMDGAML
jgi:hypothetical protein